MRPSTLLLVTWIIWLTAKKRLGNYWQLATTYAADLPAESDSSGPGSDLSHATSLPGFSHSTFIDLSNVLT